MGCRVWARAQRFVQGFGRSLFGLAAKILRFMVRGVFLN